MPRAACVRRAGRATRSTFATTGLIADVLGFLCDTHRCLGLSFCAARLILVGMLKELWLIRRVLDALVIFSTPRYGILRLVGNASAIIWHRN